MLEALLAFVYEGSCQVEVGLLIEMLDASGRLVVSKSASKSRSVPQFFLWQVEKFGLAF